MIARADEPWQAPGSWLLAPATRTPVCRLPRRGPSTVGPHSGCAGAAIRSAPSRASRLGHVAANARGPRDTPWQDIAPSRPRTRPGRPIARARRPSLYWPTGTEHPDPGAHSPTDARTTPSPSFQPRSEPICTPARTTPQTRSLPARGPPPTEPEQPRRHPRLTSPQRARIALTRYPIAIGAADGNAPLTGPVAPAAPSLRSSACPPDGSPMGTPDFVARRSPCLCATSLPILGLGPIYVLALRTTPSPPREAARAPSWRHHVIAVHRPAIILIRETSRGRWCEHQKGAAVRAAPTALRPRGRGRSPAERGSPRSCGGCWRWYRPAGTPVRRQV